MAWFRAILFTFRLSRFFVLCFDSFLGFSFDQRHDSRNRCRTRKIGSESSRTKAIHQREYTQSLSLCFFRGFVYMRTHSDEHERKTILRILRAVIFFVFFFYRNRANFAKVDGSLHSPTMRIYLTWFVTNVFFAEKYFSGYFFVSRYRKILHVGAEISVEILVQVETSFFENEFFLNFAFFFSQSKTGRIRCHCLCKNCSSLVIGLAQKTDEKKKKTRSTRKIPSVSMFPYLC